MTFVSDPYWKYFCAPPKKKRLHRKLENSRPKKRENICIFLIVHDFVHCCVAVFSMFEISSKRSITSCSWNRRHAWQFDKIEMNENRYFVMCAFHYWIEIIFRPNLVQGCNHQRNRKFNCISKLLVRSETPKNIRWVNKRQQLYGSNDCSMHCSNSAIIGAILLSPEYLEIVIKQNF